jgi:hypothetical protein
LAVEHGADERRGIVFKHLAVGGAKAYGVVILRFANCAEFHTDSNSISRATLTINEDSGRDIVEAD